MISVFLQRPWPALRERKDAVIELCLSLSSICQATCCMMSVENTLIRLFDCRANLTAHEALFHDCDMIGQLFNHSR